MKKTLSILLVMILVIGAMQLTAFAYDVAYGFTGFEYGENCIEYESIDTVINGAIVYEQISENQFTATFSADSGYILGSNDIVKCFHNQDVNDEDFTYTVSESYTEVIYTYTVNDPGSPYFQAFGGSPDVTNYSGRILDGGFPGCYYVVHVEFVEGEVPTPTPQPQPLPDLYAVRVESNPAGVATFSGYGTGFQDGDAYNVAILSADPNYEFTGWTGSPSGSISGADVSLVANFEQVVFEDEETPEALEVRYEVSAVSEPAGIGTFTGEGLFRSGDSFNVQVATVMEGYEFLRWETVNTGVVDGADVEVVAVFAEITKEEPIEEVPAEEPVEEVLDEEIPEDVDALPDTSGVPFALFSVVGAMISGGGLYIRKKK